MYFAVTKKYQLACFFGFVFHCFFLLFYYFFRTFFCFFRLIVVVYILLLITFFCSALNSSSFAVYSTTRPCTFLITFSFLTIAFPTHSAHLKFVPILLCLLKIGLWFVVL